MISSAVVPANADNVGFQITHFSKQGFPLEAGFPRSYQKPGRHRWEELGRGGK
jgi:hypothetical protein